MAKDAKGHGSDARGGEGPHRQSSYVKQLARLGLAGRGGVLPRAASALHYEESNDLGSLHESNLSAARALRQGNPKANVVPIHGGAYGRVSGSGA